ncbi:histidine phosphatase family protein [Phenylobacterium sp. J367]|uniref:histidine phosphatase family protein n=1 Tax=Phenylobacterium sp. J367 TaxID=2898435 RepID=UPI002151B4F1|nr:histidine phosphatase family protein [Phenylobacterium sp. J367]MCR5878047.1 phosphoglycerate mutase family protein [Phenylobacterium sp. J367]
MATVFVVTHPEVVQDPAVPVPLWGLSEVGVDRMQAFAGSPAVAKLAALWSSGETKALESAAILSAALSLIARVDADLHENDRSATGYLPPPEFEATADAFFAAPEVSIRGWERAVDAQARMAAAVERCLAASPPGDVAIVGHGGVSALLLCKLSGAPISRTYDQPFAGCYWTFDRETRAVTSGWKPIAPR